MKRIGITQQPQSQQIEEQLPSYLLNDPQIVGYDSVKEQRTVYYFATFGLFDDSSSVSILDFGSGRGDLFGYLDEAQVDVSRYIAVDSDPVRVDIASKKYNLNTELVNVLDPDLDVANHQWNSDWVFCILTLNQPNNDQQDKWLKLRRLVENAVHFADKGVVLILSHQDVFGGESFPIPNVVDMVCEYGYRFAVDYTEPVLTARSLYKIVIFK